MLSRRPYFRWLARKKRFLVNFHSKLAGLFVDFPNQIVGHLCQFQEISSTTFHQISDEVIVVDPGILLVPRQYLSWQKLLGKITALNLKIDYYEKIYNSIKYFLWMWSLWGLVPKLICLKINHLPNKFLPKYAVLSKTIHSVLSSCF